MSVYLCNRYFLKLSSSSRKGNCLISCFILAQFIFNSLLFVIAILLNGRINNRAKISLFHESQMVCGISRGKLFVNSARMNQQYYYIRSFALKYHCTVIRYLNKIWIIYTVKPFKKWKPWSESSWAYVTLPQKQFFLFYYF